MFTGVIYCSTLKGNPDAPKMPNASQEPNTTPRLGAPDSARGRREDFPYDIFISYRWRDGREIANWLSRRLRAYRAPRGFLRVINPLRIYLDIERERVTP